MVTSDILQPMKGSKSMAFPSHILHANDILIFCKGAKSNMTIIYSFFTQYAKASSQVFNTVKSYLYCGSISYSRLSKLLNIIGYSKG